MGLTEMGPVDLAPGGWRTLESFYGKVGSTIAVFRVPAGVRLKVRYGWGWFGYNRQGKTTDARTTSGFRCQGSWAEHGCRRGSAPGPPCPGRGSPKVPDESVDSDPETGFDVSQHHSFSTTPSRRTQGALR